MPAKSSSRTIRVRGLAPDLSLETFKRGAVKLNEAASQSKRPSFFTRSASTVSEPECSLALQGDAKTGTVTFGSADIKDKAIKKDKEWEVDDTFDGLTVLYTAENADLE